MEGPAPAVAVPALLTASTLATLGGLATAVLIVVDSVHSATGWTSSWFGFVLALMLALVVEFTRSQASVDRSRVARITLALINGCLVFTTALGSNQMASRAIPRVDQPHISVSPSSSRAPFFHDWLR